MKYIVVKIGTNSSERVLHVRGRIKVGEKIQIVRKGHWIGQPDSVLVTSIPGMENHRYFCIKVEWD